MCIRVNASLLVVIEYQPYFMCETLITVVFNVIRLSSSVAHTQIHSVSKALCLCRSVVLPACYCDGQCTS